MKQINPDDIIVEVWGKWADKKLSLSDWVRNGPNKRYLLQGPNKAWHKNSGVDIPVKEIPYPFRNNEYSARLILDEIAVDPWNRDRESLQSAVEIMTESRADDHDENYKSIKSKYLEERSSAEKSGEETLYDLCWKVLQSSE